MLQFLFTGDFAPCGGFESIALSKGSGIFGDLAEDIASADLAFVNLESPLCLGGKPIIKTGPNIRAHSDCIKAVANAGFDVVGLANNHIMDFGPEGLNETLQACKGAGLSICGAGETLSEAQEPLQKEVKGVRIAYIAVAEHEFNIAEINKAGAAPLDPIDNTLQIKAAKKEADLVFVTIHGGNEYFEYPRPGLRKICRYYIDMGADAVTCHHPHVPGVYEFYQDKPIFYSLGNLVFDHNNPPNGWDEGYAISLQYDLGSNELKKHEIIPYTQSVLQGGIKKLEGKEKLVFLNRLKDFRHAFSDRKTYEDAWGDFCESKKISYLKKTFLPFKIRGLSKVVPLVKWAMPDSGIAELANIIRCESHHELLLHILEKCKQSQNKKNRGG